MKYLVFSIVVLFGLSACSNNQVESKVDEVTGHQYFGEKINSDGAVALAEVTKKLTMVDSFPAKVRGKVDAVCQAKGCWMNIVNDEGDEVFVKFKDYGFFMPFDCAGKEVIMEGYAFKEVTSVDELRHYAEDNGDSPEQIAEITEPEEELKFMASGVILLN